jgi:hypothetical protein
MQITMTYLGVTVTCDVSEQDEAQDAMTRAVAHVRSLGAVDRPTTPNGGRAPALNEAGLAAVQYVRDTPGCTFIGAMNAGHEKKTISWLCKKNYLAFDSKTQLLTVV